MVGASAQLRISSNPTAPMVVNGEMALSSRLTAHERESFGRQM